MTPHSPPLPCSPSKHNRDQADQAESPVVPPQDTEPIITNNIKPVSLDTMAPDPPTQPPPTHRSQVRTPEPRPSQDRINGQRDTAERSPSTPGHLAPFDWDEFESRYEQALAEANHQEQDLLEEFDQLVKVSSGAS